MKVLFIGKNGFDYNRVQVILNGLKKIDNVEVKIQILDKKKFNLDEYRKLEQNFDVIYIPPFRPSDNRFISKRAKIPVIYDPLISTYMTRMNDYKQYWKGLHKYFVDKLNFESCDILLADTQHHKDYFIRKFKISPDKIFVLPIGVDRDVFYPVALTKKNDKFRVGFYGSFIPLQGIMKIVETANLLKDKQEIVFEIIGKGFEFKKATSKAKKYNLNNIIFHGRLPYEELSAAINNFDITLGIFGDSLKTDVVIPNKIYHYAAIKKCTITKDTPGIKEIFTDKKDIVLCTNNPTDIAEKILYLFENRNIFQEVAENAFSLITTQYNEIKIAEKFLEICNFAINREKKM